MGYLQSFYCSNNLKILRSQLFISQSYVFTVINAIAVVTVLEERPLKN